MMQCNEIQPYATAVGKRPIDHVKTNVKVNIAVSNCAKSSFHNGSAAEDKASGPTFLHQDNSLKS